VLKVESVLPWFIATIISR